MLLCHNREENILNDRKVLLSLHLFQEDSYNIEQSRIISNYIYLHNLYDVEFAKKAIIIGHFSFSYFC